MTEPRRWLESRHLARSDEGSRALATLERLAPEARAAIVTRGDELAVLSVGLAHAWLIAASAAHDELARDEAALINLFPDERLGRGLLVAALLECGFELPLKRHQHFGKPLAGERRWIRED